MVKCERLLDSAEERRLLTSTIAPAVDHVHARIGTAQSPQVADVEHAAVAQAVRLTSSEGLSESLGRVSLMMVSDNGR